MPRKPAAKKKKKELRSDVVVVGRDPDNLFVDPRDLPEYINDTLSRVVSFAAKNYYSNPENQTAFEQWLQSKELSSQSPKGSS